MGTHKIPNSFGEIRGAPGGGGIPTPIKGSAWYLRIKRRKDRRGNKVSSK
jgi:hypothetical protein